MKYIQEHLRNCVASLRSAFDVSSLTSHGASKGSAREVVVADFLISNLPSNLDFTAGSVFDSKNSSSGQIDIVIYSKHSLKLNFGKGMDMVPVDSVLALIECKSSLNTGSMVTGSSHLKKALDSCLKAKSLVRINPIGMDEGYLKQRNLPLQSAEMLEQATGMCATLNKTPFLIFSFNGPEEGKLRDSLYEYMRGNGIDLDDMPDVITVLDKGYYLVKNNGFLIKKIPGNVHYSAGNKENGALTGFYLYLMKLAESQKLSQNFFPIEKYMS
ncbi:DUF6602 domain-containing protein [Pseudomonas aeruginosa]|uniref:DUF6602 domain-containing protein n=1 Tax=Pseudomonas aeruginosa TaxID=287 RepID=UPI00376F5086